MGRAKKPQETKLPDVDIETLPSVAKAVEELAAIYRRELKPPTPEEVQARRNGWRKAWPFPWDRLAEWFEKPEQLAQFLGTTSMSLGRWADKESAPELESRIKLRALAKVIGVVSPV